MKTFILSALALAALSVSIATAQTPPTPAQMATHMVEHLTMMLDLNSTQQTEATAIFTKQATDLSTVRSSDRTEQAALITAIKANDATGISAAAAQLGTLHTQPITIEATASAAFYLILTNAQQTKYADFGLLHGPGPGGRGGPGGPPPGGPMN
jgi:Spy/CpxP family protein refolding chaperone